MKRSLLLVTFLLLSFGSAPAQNKILLSAMKDELTRSMEQLKLENQPAPYFISYFLSDTSSLRIISDSGAITVNNEGRNRTLKLELRVGSYTQDNSNFLDQGNLGAGITSNIVAIPRDDDYDLIRRRLWQATDRAYKNAIEALNRKKSALQNTFENDPLPDFTKGEVQSSISPENPMLIQKQNLIQLIDQISRAFLNQPGIQNSKADLTVQINNSYYVNSEGTTGIEPSSATQLVIAANTQAADGMPLYNYKVYTAALPQGLPSAAILETDIKTLISELLQAKSAPIAGEYSGPVLFAGDAASGLISQGFAKLMTGRKLPLSSNPQLKVMLSRQLDNPFVNKMNTKVAASFLSVKALPSLKTYNQKPVLGSYKMDEEGILAHDVSLIENGILKNLLVSRTPVQGITESNGHARGGTANPSVLQVISTNKKPYAQLKQDLINAAKEEGFEFGYIIRGVTPSSEAMNDASGIAGQQGQQESTQFRIAKPYSVFRVYADGREEMVRGLELGSINTNSLKNVMATSDDEFVSDYLISTINSVSGGGGISVLLSGISPRPNYATIITPSLLLSGIDLKKSVAAYPRLPIVPYPEK
jgi:predicted Zn-dependent protease